MSVTKTASCRQLVLNKLREVADAEEQGSATIPKSTLCSIFAPVFDEAFTISVLDAMGTEGERVDYAAFADWLFSELDVAPENHGAATHGPEGKTLTDWQQCVFEELHALAATVAFQEARIQELERRPTTLAQVHALASTVVDLEARIKELQEGAQSAAVTDGAHVPDQKSNGIAKRAQIGTAICSGDDVPFNYDEALKLIGGVDKLTKHKPFSEELQRRYQLDPSIRHLLPQDLSAGLARSVVINYQDYVDTLDELFEQIEAVYHPFQSKMAALAASTQGEACLPPLKGRSRCEAKARFKYVDLNGGVAWYRLTDVLRDTLLYNDLDAMYFALQVLENDTAFEIIEFNDRYQTPLSGGYRDLQLSVRFKGVVCEIQLSTRPMVRVKELRGHRGFEVKREILAAVAAGDVARCQNIILWGKENLGQDADVQLQNILNDTGSALIHNAARHGHSEIISCLLQHEADANVRDNQQRTPLHFAIAGAHERAVWALLSRGHANQMLKDQDGTTPLLEGLIMLRSKPDNERASRAVSLLAQRAGADFLAEVKKDLQQALKTRYKPSSDLCSAAFDGDTDKVREHLCHFADPDSTDKEGLSALRLAISKNRTQAAQLLLAVGAKACDLCFSLAMTNKNFDLCEALYNASEDLSRNFFSFIEGAGSGNHKYGGIAPGPDGCLYCAPHNSDKVMVVDPKTRSLSFIEGAGSGDCKYRGIAPGPDGCLYCAPCNSDKVMVINVIGDQWVENFRSTLAASR